MPLLTAALTIPVIATAMAVPATALVIERPQAADIYAVLGAILASLISLIQARYKSLDLGPALSNFLASAFAGVCTPKVGYLCLVELGTLTADSDVVKAWEAWAFSGFICGLNGWLVISRTTAALKRFLPKAPTDSAE